MRRFYKAVGIAPAAASGVDGYHVLLDGRVLKTPAKSDLLLPNTALAEAVAAEWAAQDEQIKPESMPLMRFCATALDRVAQDRGFTIDELTRYGGSDLLCYRAEEPPALAERQQREWQPLLDWFAQRYDIGLNVTVGIMAVKQPEDLPARLARILEALDHFRLVALHSATTASGSLVIGLALLSGHVDADAAYRAGQLDELFQTEAWGEDEEAAERRAGLQEELRQIERFLALL